MSVLHKSLKWQLPCWVGEWLTCMIEALGAQRQVPQRGPQHKRSSCLAPPRPGTGLGQPTEASGHAPSASETGRVSLCWTSHYSCKRTAAWLTTNQLSDARKRSRNPSLTCFIHVLFQFCIHCWVLFTNVPCATGAAYHKITHPFLILWVRWCIIFPHQYASCHATLWQKAMTKQTFHQHKNSLRIIHFWKWLLIVWLAAGTPLFSNCASQSDTLYFHLFGLWLYFCSESDVWAVFVVTAQF